MIWIVRAVCIPQVGTIFQQILGAFFALVSSANFLHVHSTKHVWCVTTDGDATRQKAGHRVFLKNQLPIMSLLHGTLSNLPGMNLYMGDGEVTLDFDYKHIIKHKCSHPYVNHCHQYHLL